MNIDCEWLDQNLENFFCGRLSEEETRKAQLHVETCPVCGKIVRGLQAVDPLVRQVFQYNLALARTPRRVRIKRLVPIFATAAAVVVAAGLWVTTRNAETPSLSPAQPAIPRIAVAPSNPPEAPTVIKNGNPEDIERTKPTAPPANAAPALPARNANDIPLDKRPLFVVSDAAGYSRTLSDFKGHVLIFGVWSNREPRTIAAIQGLYETYGSNPAVRVLGVSNERQVRPASGAFPVAYNEDSQLLGAQASDVVIVDGGGVVRFRGSLLANSETLAKSIRTALAPLGVR